jgi:5'-3' exonuclease
MGIRTFYKWLQWAAPKALHEGPIDWSTFRGQRIAVDSLGFLYRAKQTKTSVFLCLVDLLCAWRRHGVDAVFVFDGKSPQEKNVTTAARKRHRDRLPDDEQAHVHVSSADCNIIKRFLYASGFLCLNAEGEADSVLAFLARSGAVTAILSSDYDLLPRGCPRLLMPPMNPTEEAWKDIRLCGVLEEARITYTQFLHICVLLGSDYSPTVPSLSYQSAHWAVRYTPDAAWLDILKKEGIRNPSMWVTAETILSGCSDTWASLLSPRQREKWEQGSTGVEVEALTEIWETQAGLEAIRPHALQELLGTTTPASKSTSRVSDSASDTPLSSSEGPTLEAAIVGTED